MAKAGIKGLLLLSLLMISSVSFSDSLVVDYVDGDVDIRIKGQWKPVSFGDKLPIESSIRLGKDSLIELVSGGDTISIFEQGVYRLDNIVNASKKVSSWGVADLFEVKMKAVFAGEETVHGKESQAGVRGPDQSVSLEDEVEFIDIEEDDEFIREGLSSIEKGNYKEALAVFQEGLGRSTDNEDKITYRYYIAYTCSQMEKKALALKYLTEVDIPDEHPFLRDIVILKGRLLVEGMAFQEALNVCSGYLTKYPDGEFAQALLIISSYCYRGLGDVKKAKKTLSSAVEIDPATAIGKEAEKILESL
ncbi:MAG: hypothetical protein JW881_03400 [Spirochaetales bacterium]|nr:hypothetical protein [Spirochaetales bacterium]